MKKEKIRHNWKYVGSVGDNNLYQCQNCRGVMLGDLDRVSCPDDCPEEIHFCKKEWLISKEVLK